MHSKQVGFILEQLIVKMIEILVALVLLGLMLVTYQLYIVPYLESKRYAKLIRSLGYSVYEAPFRPWSTTFNDDMKEDARDKDDACWREKHVYNKYDVIVENHYSKVVLAFVKPELIKDFFKPDVSTHNKIKTSIGGIALVMGNGLVFREKESWKTEKKIVSKTFNFDFLVSQIPEMRRIFDRNVERMEAMNKLDENRFKYFLLDLGNNNFQEIMMRCFFSCDQLEHKVKGMSFADFSAHVINEANIVESHPLVVLFGSRALHWKLTPKLRQLHNDIALLRGIAADLITKRKEEIQEGINAGGRYPDIIESFMTSELSKHHTMDDLINEFITFLIAGTDSTAHLLMMMVYLLHDHPTIAQKLRAEMNQHITCEEDITHENIKKMAYLDWFQKETTRHYGPGTNIFVREASVDQFIGKIPVTKGTGLFCHSVSNHYNEAFYKNPFEFRPERWESECDNLPAYALMGFGGGPRTCTGKQLALLSAKVALIKMLRRYERFELPDVKRKFTLDFFYSPNPMLTTCCRKPQTA